MSGPSSVASQSLIPCFSSFSCHLSISGLQQSLEPRGATQKPALLPRLGTGRTSSPMPPITANARSLVSPPRGSREG
eukprot:7198777-Pyramimonas_sp.AAC.1